MRNAFRMSGTSCAVGVLTGAMLTMLLIPRGKNTSAADSPPPKAVSLADVGPLKFDVERLKQIVPDQAHAMSDVDYHFSNLWFAGKAKNWPLAEFYWKESLSHLRWAV